MTTNGNLLPITELSLTAIIEDRETLSALTGENTIIVSMEFDVEYFDKDPGAHEVYYGATISVSNFRFRTPWEDYTLDEALDCALIDNEDDFKEKVKNLIKEYISRNKYIEDEDEIYPTFEQEQIGSEFKVVSISSKDISEETKQFLLDDLADYVAAGFNTGLFFSSTTISEVLENDFFDEEDRPTEGVLNELKALKAQMASSNANFLFFN